MLAYAASRPVAGKAPSSPPAMLLIICAHLALIAIVMSAKMEFPRIIKDKNPKVVFVPAPPPPPGPTTNSRTSRTREQVDHPDTHVTTPPLEGTQLAGGQAIDSGATLGNGNDGFPTISWPVATPIRHDPRLLTPASELKPPYPESKILSEEEATLQLRLTISDSGRVTSVDPVGAADRVFLDAARKYLIAHWRYSPATEDGRAIASSVVISLHFQLDG